jgi:hypothetical protein
MLILHYLKIKALLLINSKKAGISGLGFGFGSMLYSSHAEQSFVYVEILSKYWMNKSINESGLSTLKLVFPLLPSRWCYVQHKGFPRKCGFLNNITLISNQFSFTMPFLKSSHLSRLLAFKFMFLTRRDLQGSQKHWLPCQFLPPLILPSCTHSLSFKHFLKDITCTA